MYDIVFIFSLVIICIVGCIVMILGRKCSGGGFHNYKEIESDSNSYNVLNKGLFSDRLETRYYTTTLYECEKCKDKYKEIT